MADYFLFIDDSGSKDWETPHSPEFISNPPQREAPNLNFWRGNYFCLAGLYIPRTLVATLNPQIEALKLQIFGTKHIEIKSVWMRNPEKRKKHYLEPFKITDSDLLDFTEGWYRIFSQHHKKIRLQAFVLDKRYYSTQRKEHSPLQCLSQVLFDRVELNPRRECTIVIDQMDKEIKSHKNRQGEILKISNKEVSLHSYQEKYSMLDVRFESSATSNFLQLADTIAYNVYRQFVDFGKLSSKPTPKNTYPFLLRTIPNFCTRNGRINGCGIVKVPKVSPSKNPPKRVL